MNWLAHLLLAEPSAVSRIGNLLPDLLSPGELRDVAPMFAEGVERHRFIDAFTDAHPVVRRSIGRLGPDYRRVGGIVVDVFYDHFLAVDWNLYSNLPLPLFAREVYGAIKEFQEHIPAEVFVRLRRMGEHDWLCAYGRIEAIGETLRRIEMRMGRPVRLADALSLLREDYDGLQADFREFFPALVARVQKNAPRH